MADSQTENVFKAQLLDLLKDIRENTGSDPRTAVLIGSAAAKLLDDTETTDWSTFKNRLSKEAYDELLKSCDDDISRLKAKGEDTIAYAVQAIAMSVIASRMTDPSTATGNELLDAVINRNIEIFREAKSRAEKAPAKTMH